MYRGGYREGGGESARGYPLYRGGYRGGGERVPGVIIVPWRLPRGGGGGRVPGVIHCIVEATKGGEGVEEEEISIPLYRQTHVGSCMFREVCSNIAQIKQVHYYPVNTN